MTTSRDWEYKPDYLTKYYSDFDEDDDPIITENKMIDRAEDVIDDIVARYDVGALEWFYFNWINSIGNSYYEDLAGFMMDDLLDEEDREIILTMVDFIDFFVYNFTTESETRERYAVIIKDFNLD